MYHWEDDIWAKTKEGEEKASIMSQEYIQAKGRASAKVLRRGEPGMHEEEQEGHCGWRGTNKGQCKRPWSQELGEGQHEEASGSSEWHGKLLQGFPQAWKDSELKAPTPEGVAWGKERVSREGWLKAE